MHEPASPGRAARVVPEGVAVRRAPVAPARFAADNDLMPLRSTGVEQFRRTHPTYDGRGVLIAILDTGVDPRVDGLETTSTGAPKIVDIRDFSGEGRVSLAPLERREDELLIAGATVGGAARVASMAIVNERWYGGWVDERAFGPEPGGDLDGNGSAQDRFGAVVVRTLSGWVAFIDLDGDGTVGDEDPVRDFLDHRQSVTFADADAGRGEGPVGVVINLREEAGRPALDLVVDNAGHGTHVAGIAGAHGIGRVAGFDGVAPGAQLLALKIADNARGGVTVSGSVLAAVEYATRFAAARQLPVVINLSFGVGNGREGHAVIDSAVNAFLEAHPDIVFVISAGNDGPGLSTVGFPGSTDLALSIGALYPSGFLSLATGIDAGDALAEFSARGGELAKPDLVAPGVAYSTVPTWNAGEEIKGGTSFAAPHVAGLAALLISAATQDARVWTAHEIGAALVRSAEPIKGGSALDQGAGMPHVGRAWRELTAGLQAPPIVVRTVPMGGNGSAASAAFRRGGFAGPADTLQRFLIDVLDRDGLPLKLYLESDVGWIEPPPEVWLSGDTTMVEVRYRPDRSGMSDLAIGRVYARYSPEALGPAVFTLTSAVAHPADLASRPLMRSRRLVEPGSVARYFVRVPAEAGGLAVRLRRVDGRMAGLAVFEPSGRPVPPGPAVNDSMVFVRSEDLVAGVYELTVVAPADAPALYDLDAVAGPQIRAEVRGDTVTVATPSVEVFLTGAQLAWSASGRGATPQRRTFHIPAWAQELEIDVTMPLAQWDRFTDFGVTVFAEPGDRIATDPMSYPASRMRVPVKAVADDDVVLELFPGLALAYDASPWQVEVTIRALPATPRSLKPTEGRFVASSDELVLEDPAWRHVVEAVIREANAPIAARRVVVGGR